MNNQYSRFHEGFFEELRRGVIYEEGRSVLCSYFREEKRNHEKVRAAKHAYETAAVYGPPAAPVKGKPKKTAGRDETKSGRRSADRQPAVEILCAYYGFLADYENARRQNDRASCRKKAAAFLDELQRLADMAKAGKKRKNEVYEEIEAMRKDYRHGGIERLTERVMDLHLYAEAVQFLYNAGYPMPKENSRAGDAGDACDMRLEKLAASRIKTIPLALMDLYFSRKEISFETISAANRMTPHQVARSEDMAGEIEEMYDFACENEMKSAVIPLLIDNDTGSGLYIIGKSYLKSWDFDKERKRTVLKILNGRPCCYAIIKFLNIETGKNAADAPYVWSPYSVVDMITESGEINPENILFSDLDEALDIYQGQLNAKAQGILYDNFREANWFDEEENAELIPEMYRRYFYVPEPEDADADMEDVRAEYDRLCREEFSVQKRT